MKDTIIDFHTHAFPDALASRAMKALLEEAPGVNAYLDGTMADLLRSMDRVGIERSVVCCIATKPAQFEPILAWCVRSRSDRLVFFPSVHPADPNCGEAIRRIRQEGFQGVKLHPYYQDFVADEDRMLGFYEEVLRQDLILVMHTGYDIAFPRIRRADPQRLVKIKERLADLKLVSTHMGAWEQWDEVQQYMIGRPIYMEVSFAMDGLPTEQARQMLVQHPDEYVLFGTDSPWTDQAQTLSWLKKMDLPAHKISKILAGNAERLLGLPA